ncbi:phospholipase D-like domain-containing protein [Pontibacter sp. H249]|uniref:phospholipase D-like domain-containing protein n=1 Tax=Pontibacter sp. H249 TaxID=3133420 RepID=UPI0030C134AF
MTQTYFSEIEFVLISNLNKAETSIKVAVAWFTNQKLLDLLLTKLSEGVKVELIIRDDYINNSADSLSWADFYKRGGKISFSGTEKLLHHKYCIIDEVTVITGSYNWTNQAERVNQENIVVISEQQVAESYICNFENLKSSCRSIDDITLLNFRQVEEAPLIEKHFLEDDVTSTKKSTNTETILEEAAKCYLNKDYSRAIALLKSSWNDLSQIPEAYETLAWSLARNGQGEEALVCAERGIALDSKNPELSNVIGFVHDANKQHGKAIECFDKAIKLAPHLTPYYWNKIFSLYKLGSISNAEKVSTELVKIASNILKKKEKYTPYDRMHAFIDRGNAKFDRVSREEDGKKAKAIYNSLQDNQKDLHDLDSINNLLFSK